MPPRLSFSVLHVDDSLELGTYVVVALIAGQLTARIRAQEQQERKRERRATALFHLTRALAGARTFDEAAEAALRQADELFNARTALLLNDEKGGLAPHAASSLREDEQEAEVAAQAWRQCRATGRFTHVMPGAKNLHLPLLRAGTALGVLMVLLPAEQADLPPVQMELLTGFAAQIALFVEREQLRMAGEREKFFAESDRLHRTLLDSVSHELKTPLAVLRTAAEKIGTDDAEKRRGLAEEIGTATGRLEHLVANLLNQTRLEAGGLTAQLDWCDAFDLIGAARSMVGSALIGRPFKIELAEDMPLFLADGPLMEQVISNLLLNAALHTPASTPIVVSGGLDTERRRIFLSVTDRGPGLPPELLGSLFRKFQRGKNARPGGLGLGLSIVQGFMLAQGGEVVAANNPDGGARFAVCLPYTIPGNVPNDEH